MDEKRETRVSEGEIKPNENLEEKKTERDISEDDERKVIVDSFEGLPMETLTYEPILAVAKGQQELTAAYLDTMMKLAYRDDTGITNSGKKANDDTNRVTNAIDFTMKRPVIKEDGKVEEQEAKITVPLISLVPVPAFTMDELTVDFNMEVKKSELQQSDTKTEGTANVSYNSFWGLSANITGSVTDGSMHKRETDCSDTYKVHARATQQKPSEGMAELQNILQQTMEPLPDEPKGNE